MPSDALRYIDEFMKQDLNIEDFEGLYAHQIDGDNIGYLEDVISLLEMRIASLEQVSKKLKLRRNNYYLGLVSVLSESD